MFNLTEKLPVLIADSGLERINNQEFHRNPHTSLARNPTSKPRTGNFP
jgi:hypothetical protein